MSGRVPLVVPQLGVVEEIVVLEWLVEDDARVEVGQEVVSIDTEKADVMLEAPATGTLTIVVRESDETVPVGATLAYVTP